MNRVMMILPMADRIHGFPDANLNRDCSSPSFVDKING